VAVFELADTTDAVGLLERTRDPVEREAERLRLGGVDVDLDLARRSAEHVDAGDVGHCRKRWANLQFGDLAQ
jgi:hypothetical protein